MSDIIDKCTETRPDNVGWYVGRSLLRKAATPWWLFKCSHLKGYIISPLVSLALHRHQGLFHYTSVIVAFGATNSPIYVSCLSWIAELILQLPAGFFYLYVSHVPHI